MVRAFRWPRGAISLLVVCMLSPGPFAQGVDVGPDESIEPVDASERDPSITVVRPDEDELLSNIDGFFTENIGQKAEGAGLFYIEGRPMAVSFHLASVSYIFCGNGDEQWVMVRTTFRGANPVSPIGADPLHHISNHFIGRNSDHWRMGVRSYREVLYPSIYDGIDLRYFLKDGLLKYEFILDAGVTPDLIHLGYEGISVLSLDETTGDLEIVTPIGTISDMAPISYQQDTGGTIEVQSSFEIDGTSVGFKVEGYDPTLPLVIDPGLVFSTFLGGSGQEFTPSSLAVDEDGNIFIGVVTASTDFPVTPGAFSTSHSGTHDIAIVKMKPDASDVLYSTFIGGTGAEYIGKLELDKDEHICVCGITTSTDFPITSGAIQTKYQGGDSDGFLLKLNTTGDALRFSTYVGGSGDEGWQGTQIDLRLDDRDDIYMVGVTASTDFPVDSSGYDTTHGGNFVDDAFILKIDPNGTKIERGTYFGGSSTDQASSLSFDGIGNVIIVGATWSTDLTTTLDAFSDTLGGSRDAFIASFDGNLTTLKYSTYFGGSDTDHGTAGVTDANGHLYCAGYTQSRDLPVTLGAMDSSLTGTTDVFFSKFKKDLSGLEYSTFFGGTDSDSVFDITLGSMGSLVFVIQCESTDIDVSDNAYDATHNGKGDADVYIGVLASDGSFLEYGSFVGGSKGDYPHCVVYLGDGHALFSGGTRSPGYPTTLDAFQTIKKAESDIFISCLQVLSMNGTVPSPPLNLSTEPGNRNVTLSWESPMDLGNLTLRGYMIYRGRSLNDGVPIASLPKDQTVYVENPPRMGEEYYYRVSAFNFKGEGNKSVHVKVIPTGTPFPPTEFTATSGCNTILLQWLPPEDTGGVPLSGYTVFRGTMGKELSFYQEFGNVTEFLDSDLVNGQEYRYSIHSRNVFGNSSRLPAVSSTPLGPPTEPRRFTVDPGDSQAILGWRPPASDGGRTILGYRILWGVRDTSLEVHGTVDHYQTTYIDTDLANGVTYYYAIQAYNTVGDGTLSAIVHVTPVGPPASPVGLMLEPGDGHVTLLWEPPMDTGGTEIIYFQIHRGTSVGSLTSLDYTADGDKVMYNDTGLMNGQTMYYAVSAVNKVGSGPWTDILSATPLALPDPPGDLVAQAGNGMVTISWTRPMDDGGAEVTQYNIYHGTSEDDLERVTSKAKSVFIYDDTEVTTGTTYFYAVAAQTVAGEGPLSIIASATPYGPPGQPLDLNAVPGDSEVRLSWSAPADDNGSTIEGYVIYRGVSTEDLSELVQLGEVTSYLDTSVTNDVTYWYSVAAINEAGPGDRTEAVSTTPFELIDVPGKVRIFTGEAKAGNVVLQWSSPQDDGGSPVTGYIVYRGASADDMAAVATLGPVLTWTDEDVERGQTYFYSVAAVNEAGEGEPFFAREVKVPKPKEESPGLTLLLTVTSLFVVGCILLRPRGGGKE